MGTPFNSAAFASPHPLPLRRSETSSSERDFILRVSWPGYFEWCLSEDKVVEKLHKKIKIKTNIIGGIIVSSSYVYSWCFDTPQVSISCYRSSPSAISLASSFPVTPQARTSAPNADKFIITLPAPPSL